MARSADAPQGDPLYHTDFLAWTERQARAIEMGRWSEVDATNIADEVASLGRQLVREAEERVEILISYLLKWRHLAEYRGRAWKENISRQRDTLAELFESSPSLEQRKDQLLANAYGAGRQRLKYETYFYETDFPASCPFTVQQVLDREYFPEELDVPAIDMFPTARKIA